MVTAYYSEVIVIYCIVYEIRSESIHLYILVKVNIYTNNFVILILINHFIY